MSKTIYFLYKKTGGAVSARAGEKAYMVERQGVVYVSAISEGKRKSFKESGILNLFDSLEEAEDEFTYNKLITRKKGLIIDLPYIVDEANPNKFDICFTGFSSGRKNGLIDLANSAGVKVRKSVVVGLNVLCCGIRAGKSKIETAKEQGTAIVSEKEFRDFLATGEL